MAISSVTCCWRWRASEMMVVSWRRPKTSERTAVPPPTHLSRAVTPTLRLERLTRPWFAFFVMAATSTSLMPEAKIGGSSKRYHLYSIRLQHPPAPLLPIYHSQHPKYFPSRRFHCPDRSLGRPS